MKHTGVLHMHSTYSYDGKVSLAELKQLLFEHGISFCCMTEHTDELTPDEAAEFVAECKRLSDQAFVFVPGFEVPYLPAGVPAQAGQDAHVLMIGSEQFLGQVATVEMLLQWREVSPLVVLAHPVRNRFVVDETLASVLSGVEVWNQQYEGKHAPRSRSLALYKELRAQRPELLATGGLDFHRREHLGTPQVELEMDTLSTEEVVRQLRLGFYTLASHSVALDARGTFHRGGGVISQLQSAVSIGVIAAGKKVNATLAASNLSLPKGLRRWLRRRV